MFSLKYNANQIFRRLASIYFPFLYSFAGMALIISFSISNQVFIDNLAKSILYLIFSIPVIVYMEKKSSLINKIVSSFNFSKK
jgi:hypothetical protein